MPIDGRGSLLLAGRRSFQSPPDRPKPSRLADAQGRIMSHRSSAWSSVSFAWPTLDAADAPQHVQPGPHRGPTFP